MEKNDISAAHAQIRLVIYLLDVLHRMRYTNLRFMPEVDGEIFRFISHLEDFLRKATVCILLMNFCIGPCILKLILIYLRLMMLFKCLRKI